jgi:hypothetical protein
VDKNAGSKCGGRLSNHIYISGRKTNFIPLFSLDIFLAHPEVRKIEFNNNALYGFNEIITLIFKIPDSKSMPCL